MMSSRLIRAMLAALALTGLPALGEDVNTTEQFPYKVKMFDVPGEMTDAIGDYRHQWARLTGFEFSGLHWNQFITVYTNIGEPAYQHNYLQYVNWFEDPDEPENQPHYVEYPRGTILLKENFTARAGKPHRALSVTAMIKHEAGYDREAGDWEYVQFDKQGTVILRGSSRDKTVKASCAHCHEHVKARDYVFSQIYSTLRK